MFENIYLRTGLKNSWISNAHKKKNIIQPEKWGEIKMDLCFYC